MDPREATRLARLIPTADRSTAEATLARSAGRELAALAYIVLENRSAAEHAAAVAIARTVDRVHGDGWRPDGPELTTAMSTSALRVALDQHGAVREVDPLGPAASAVRLPGRRDRAVVAGLHLAAVPPEALAAGLGLSRRALEASQRRARGILGPGEVAAWARACVDGLALGVTPQLVRSAASIQPAPASRMRFAPTVIGGLAALAVLVAALALRDTPPASPAGQEVARRPATGGAPSADAADATTGSLPTLAECGIGPPDAELAFEGVTTPASLALSLADLHPDEEVFALVPAGDVAWNPPNGRRIMPPVRGRMVCVAPPGGTPRVVGVPAGWQLPPGAGRSSDPDIAFADCNLRTADAEPVYRGWLTRDLLGQRGAEVRGGRAFAIVTDTQAVWLGPSRSPWPPYRVEEGRFACLWDPASGHTEVLSLPLAWSPPATVDGCPATSVTRFAGYLEIGGPKAYIQLPRLGGSWWADQADLRILARLSPGPADGARLSAEAARLEGGDAIAVDVERGGRALASPVSGARYVWLNDVRFPSAGCWVVTIAVDGETAGSAILPVTGRPG